MSTGRLLTNYSQVLLCMNVWIGSGVHKCKTQVQIERYCILMHNYILISNLPQFSSSSPDGHWEYPSQIFRDLRHLPLLHLKSPSYGHDMYAKEN